MPRKLKFLENDYFVVAAIIIVSLITSFDLLSDRFGWMEFQERDFSRAADFILRGRLSHLGPECSGGGFLPGPALTVLFSIPIYFLRSPLAIHVLIQTAYISVFPIIFFLVKTYFNRAIAFITLLLLISSKNYVYFAFAGWHTSLIIPLSIIVFFVFHFYLTTGKTSYLFLVGFLIGIGMQIHFSIVSYYLAGIIFFTISQPKKALRFLFVSLCGIAVSLSYYFALEVKSGFENTKHLFAGKFQSVPSTAMSIQKGSILIGDPFYKFILYPPAPVISLVVVLLGLAILVLYRNRIEVKRFVLPAAFMLWLIIFKLTIRADDSRFFLIAHPAFEILLGLSIYLLWKLMAFRFVKVLFLIFLFSFYSKVVYSLAYDRYSIPIVMAHPTFEILFWISIILMWKLTAFRFVKVLFLIFLFSYISVGVYSMADDRYSIPIVFQAGTYEPYSVPGQYFSSKRVTDFLISDLKLTPEQYRKRVYFFRGEDIWSFFPRYSLPSFSRYELEYLRRYGGRKIANGLFDNEFEGILLMEKSKKSLLNSKNLVIKKAVQDKFFTAYVYEGPYIYHQQLPYMEISADEQLVKGWAGPTCRAQKETNVLSAEAYFHVPAKRRDFSYVQRLVLRSTPVYQLSGYCEIVGSDLRQSQYGLECPYFVRKPVVKIQFSDHTQMVVPILENNFYSRTSPAKHHNSNEVYTRFGWPNESLYLGNLYVEAPYGKPILIPKKKISEIVKITFQNQGYGSWFYTGQTSDFDESNEAISQSVSF